MKRIGRYVPLFFMSIFVVLSSAVLISLPMLWRRKITALASQDYCSGVTRLLLWRRKITPLASQDYCSGVTRLLLWRRKITALASQDYCSGVTRLLLWRHKITALASQDYCSDINIRVLPQACVPDITVGNEMTILSLTTVGRRYAILSSSWKHVCSSTGGKLPLIVCVLTDELN